MLTEAGSLLGALMREVRRHVKRSVRRTPEPETRCRRIDVRSESDIRTASFNLAPASKMEPFDIQALVRELVELNTPALYINIVQRSGSARVILTPWGGRSIRFRGRRWFLDAGSESVEGVEAFANVPMARVTTLYPTAPDHPVYVLSMEHQRDLDYIGEFPSYLTHVTIVINGRVIARAERLLHERGRQIWAA